MARLRPAVPAWFPVRAMTFLLALVAMHHVALFLAQRHLLYPGAWMALPEAAAPPGVERVEVENESGTAFGLFKRTDRASADAPAPLVVYAHGNAERAVDFPWWTEPYTGAGFHVLALEYRGFGGADGAPSESGIVEDALRLVERVTSRDDVDGERVVYHGLSLGGGIAASLAARRPPSGLVLESTFSSVVSMARSYLAPRYLVRDPFDTERVLRDLYPGPVLLLHGERDDVIPPSEAARNLRAATPERARLVVAPRLGHMDAWMLHDPAVLVDFAKRVTGR